MARNGAKELNRNQAVAFDARSGRGDQRGGSSPGDPGAPSQPRPTWVAEEIWTQDADETTPDRPSKARSLPRHKVPRAVVSELESNAGSTRGTLLAERLADAAHAYERERYAEARRLLRPLIQAAPTSTTIRELLGLTLYRMGRWREAIKELETARQSNGSYDQHPVLADCYRALRRYGEVAALWEDLRVASPSAELVAEGRIVAAGALADKGEVAAAIKLLESARQGSHHPEEHHLRQWYALADLYERAGEVPKARQLFARVANADRDAFDVADRLRALR